MKTALLNSSRNYDPLHFAAQDSPPKFFSQGSRLVHPPAPPAPLRRSRDAGLFFENSYEGIARLRVGGVRRQDEGDEEDEEEAEE